MNWYIYLRYFYLWYFHYIGIEGPVNLGSCFGISFFILSCRSPITLFLRLRSNSGLCIYFTAMYAKTLIDETIRNEIIDKILAIFEKVMVKDAILRAIGHASIISLLIILPTILPLYLTMSVMTRSINTKPVN